MKVFPDEYFKNMLIVIVFSYVISCLLVEFLIVDLNIISHVRKLLFKEIKKKKYKNIEKQLQNMVDWPPIGNTTYASDNNQISESSIPMTTESGTLYPQPR